MTLQVLLPWLRAGISVTLLTGVSAAIAGPVQLAQQSSPTQLTPAQLKLLQATGLRVAAPTYLPPGFAIESVEAQADRFTRMGGLRYTIRYRKNDSQSGNPLCFAIEATNGGIGGIPTGQRSYAINSAVFGRSRLQFGRYGAAQAPTYLGEWMGSGPFYRFVGVGVTPDLPSCRNIASQDAIRITESLRYLP